MSKVVTALQGQTLIDLSLQLYGNSYNVLTLLELNPQIDNIHSDVSNMQIVYDGNGSFVSNNYAANGITPATKPLNYRNSLSGGLITEDGLFNLVQENGYKILL